MHHLPIDLFAACLGILAVLHGLSMLLTNLEIAAKRIEGRSTWIADNGHVFEEFSVTELKNSQVMRHDFEETGGEALWDAPVAVPANG
jgi:hypothetical protein